MNSPDTSLKTMTPMPALMTNLSPAAQAVLDAFLRAPYDNKLCLAAALRAVADQVVPQEPHEFEHFTNEAIRLNRMGTRFQLLALAAELEGSN